MELDAKPTETNMVLVNDKILMALLAANGIMALHVFATGWLIEPPEFKRELYMAYEQTDQVKHLIKQFEARTATIDLDAFMSALDELGNANNVGAIIYAPQSIGEKENV